MSAHLSDVEKDLANRLLDGERRALSKVLSLIEDETESGRHLLDYLFPKTGHAYRLGVTGPPGSGKSTLTDRITRLLRSAGKKVGILAVDPSSPFTGGAILGDRIRMQSHVGDPGVFIRSMASRGSLGGLAATTERACEAMDAFGFDWVVIETVGVGQSEMEVVAVADTTLVVLVPESGDGVQMMKAGLLEAGDIFAINKFDRDGGAHLQKEIEVMIGLQSDRAPKGSWEPRVVPTIAIQDVGGAELLAAVDAHRTFLTSEDPDAEGHREARIRQRIRTLMRSRVLEEAWRRLGVEEKINAQIGAVMQRKISPYGVVEKLLEEGLWTEKDGPLGGRGES